MQTRRDQLQAYRYLLRRILAAMLGSEPESLEQPMRRVSTATFAGAMVGALACAGVALYGWLADTNATRWKNEPNALIVEKETNAAYLYLPKSQLASGGDQPANHRHHPGRLGLRIDARRAGTGGLPAHIDDVGSAFEQPHPVPDRQIRIEVAATVGERVTGDIHHTHHHTRPPLSWGHSGLWDDPRQEPVGIGNRFPGAR